MGRAWLLLATLALSGCVAERCERARELAIACGHDFDAVCDEDLTNRENCEHRCYERWGCWDVQQCQRRCWFAVP